MEDMMAVTKVPKRTNETSIEPLFLTGSGTGILLTGRILALAGVVLPLLLIGGMKFTQVEIDALKPLISGTPWLAWMYPVFGEAGASYVLGVVEIATALLLVASPWRPLAGVAGGALGTLIFLVTCSIMFALPIWEPTLGFPALGPLGQFLVKDIALLGIALVVLGENLDRLGGRALARRADELERG
jgi:reactive chlorine resistance protein C